MAGPVIPVSADDVDHDFAATASPPPGTPAVRGLVALPVDPAAADPGHLATDEEWAAIVARAEGGRP